MHKTQQGLSGGMSCRTNLICFFDKITDFLDKGNAVGLIYLEFSKEFHAAWKVVQWSLVKCR